MKVNKLFLISAVTAAFLTFSNACTTILVGEEATADGSKMIARNADSQATKAQIFMFHQATINEPGSYYSTKERNGANDFKYPLPEVSMSYTTVPNWLTKVHGAVSYNSAGVGASGTETIFAKDELLKIDPYNEVSGITEDDVMEVIMPRAKSAKEAVELMGSIVEDPKIGAGEGFGIAFVDANELWWFETGTGHQWIAKKMPKNQYFATGNQGRMGNYDPASPDMLASKNLIQFAIDNGAYDPNSGEVFNFTKAYTKDNEEDVTYNYPRVWWIQQMYNPSIEQNISDGAKFAEMLVPEKKISLNDLKAALRSHYDGTALDTYINTNPDVFYRPISVFRTYEGHVMQVRSELPIEIGNVIYLAFGNTDLGVFLPYFYGVTKYPVNYGVGTNQSDNESAYWHYRKVQTLAMQNYEKYSPIVKKAYKEFEDRVAVEQAQMEKEYMKYYNEGNKMKANEILNDFAQRIMTEAWQLTDDLTNQLFTMLTEDTDQAQKAIATNAGKKD